MTSRKKYSNTNMIASFQILGNIHSIRVPLISAAELIASVIRCIDDCIRVSPSPSSFTLLPSPDSSGALFPSPSVLSSIVGLIGIDVLVQVAVVGVVVLGSCNGRLGSSLLSEHRTGRWSMAIPSLLGL